KKIGAGIFKMPAKLTLSFTKTSLRSPWNRSAQFSFRFCNLLILKSTRFSAGKPSNSKTFVF
ncbi:MAG TPA: hypothetical protein VGE29_18235, partial [Prosthecobacter sp.]